MRDEDLPNERVLLGMLSKMLSGSNADALSSVLSGEAFEPETIQTGNPLGTLPPEGEVGRVGPPRVRPDTRNILRNVSNIPAAQISRLKGVLTEYVGPMAGLLVDEKLAAGVANLDALVERLAPEIGDTKDAQKFREAVDRIK